MIEVASLSEQLGLDAPYTCDHLFYQGQPEAPFLDGWTLIAQHRLDHVTERLSSSRTNHAGAWNERLCCGWQDGYPYERTVIPCL
jgi:hypothetical protein